MEEGIGPGEGKAGVRYGVTVTALHKQACAAACSIAVPGPT